MITVQEAQTKIAALLPVIGTQSVPLAEAGGRILRTPVVAQRDQPPFAASAMDGYAIRRADLTVGAELTVIGEIAAGHSSSLTVAPGQAVRIFTGAAVPQGADYILIQEDAERVNDTIRVRDGYDTKAYVRPPGVDYAKGFTLDAPRQLSHSDIALLASLNVPKIEVSRKPVVAVIPTGDELIWPGETPNANQILASNNFGLKAMLEAEGAVVRLLPIARDTKDDLKAVFKLAAGADLIVTLGGASVGDHDLVQNTAQDEGLDLSFYKLAMRPGKPLMAGLLGGTPMLGLPGNPVSSMVCAHIFLRPAIRAFLGLGYHPDRKILARLDGDIGPNGPREHYMRATVTSGPDGWVCAPNERQDSSLLSILSASNALMIRPPFDPAQQSGAVVEFTHI